MLVRLYDIGDEVLLEQFRSKGRWFAEDVEFSVADQPVFRVGNDDFVYSQRHRAVVAELGSEVNWVCLEGIAVCRAGKQVAMVIPYVFKFG